MNDSRVAFVTGASKGIGRTIAETLVAEGYRVAGSLRSGDVPKGVHPVQCDITDQAQVDAAFDEIESMLGPVEVLVANAGVTRDTLLMRMSDDDWDQVIDTNLTGTFRVVRRAVRPMMKARFGRIVLIGSVVGLLGNPGQVNYAASKAGLVGLARSVAREYGSRGITANVVTPGFIVTAMTDELTEDQRAALTQRVPSGELGTTQDVAAAVRFLASDEARYVNGVVLPVDGGLAMGI